MKQRIICLTGIYTLLFYILRIFKIKKNKILIESSAGTSFGDSPRAIYDYLSKTPKKYEIFWVVKDKKSTTFPKNINTVKRDSIMYIYHHVTSKIWISNTRKTRYIRKRKNQFYIQTWHSPLRLKKIEKDVANILPKYVIKNSINDAKMTNLMICGSEFCKNIYENSFWYNGPVKLFGTPRCDIFFDKSKIEIIRKKVYESLNISKNKTVILYAPTFRNNINNDNFILPNFEKFSDNYIILYRFHHNSKRKNLKIDKGINVTNYPDMQELLVACDFLITDYSSSMFDMLIAKKNCILYAPDINSYIKNERSLYFNFNDLPFPMIKSNEQLFDSVKNFDRKKYLEKLNFFAKTLGLCEDGKATERICNIIKGVVESEKI